MRKKSMYLMYIIPLKHNQRKHKLIKNKNAKSILLYSLIEYCTNKATIYYKFKKETISIKMKNAFVFKYTIEYKTL